MEQESAKRAYLSLALCLAWPDGNSVLVHHTDPNRRAMFDAAMAGGAVAVGVFWILHDRQFGCVAGCQEFIDDPTWKHVFERELTIMKKLLAEDPDFRNVTSESNPLIN